MLSSSPPCSSVVQPLSKLENYRVHCLLPALLVITYAIGFLGHPRLILLLGYRSSKIYSEFTSGNWCFFFQEIIIGQWSLLANLSCFSLYLVFREHGFPWGYILMDLMGFNLALYTLSRLPARMANGPLCRVISTSFYFLLFVSRFVWIYSVNIFREMI